MSLVIVGAGGFGREVHAYALDLGWEVAGFLDDNPRALDGFTGLPPVLGGLEADIAGGHDHLVAVGDARLRARFFARLAARGVTWATLVHPTAYVGPRTTLGPGSILTPYAMVSVDARLGANVMLNTYASVAHDAVVGDHCVLSPYATINGSVILEDRVFLGTHAVVTPRHLVGSCSVLGAGAVVVTDVPAGSLMVGVPAKGDVRYDLD